jgi:hypothetical protein
MLGMPTRKELFGREDPTRFGSGILIDRGIQDPFFKLMPPYGGIQVEKTIKGIKAYTQGYNATAKGNVQYMVNKNPLNLVKTAAFGPNATAEARQYFNTGVTPLSEKQSEIFKLGAGTNYYNKILAGRQVTKEKEALKTGKGTVKAQDLGSGIYQLSDGKFYAKDADKTFDTKYEIGQYLFEKKSGKYNITSSKFTLETDRAKRNGDFKGWLTKADAYTSYLANYQATLDPNSNEYLTVTNKLEDLVVQLEKYVSYGGFTKPKKGKAAKKLAKPTIKLSTTKLKSTKLNLTPPKLSTLKLAATPTFALKKQSYTPIRVKFG